MTSVESSGLSTTGTSFPVGFHQLHPDVSMNVQMNRWFNWVGDPSMLEEMRAVAPHIQTYVDWKREFVQLAEQALARSQQLKAAYYFRSAEFFMLPSDPDKRPARQRFIQLARYAYGLSDDMQTVPYRDGDRHGSLPAYRFTPEQPKDTIVFFGGFDSYIEELIPIGFFLRDAGFEVVLFEGPGQGAALEDAGLPMTSEWEKPVAAVLDYFGLDGVTLLGLSLGGYFALRAAAFEPRVRRAIAFDIIYDFLACNLHQTNSAMRSLVDLGLSLEAGPVVNALLAAAAKRKPVIEWGLQQGMHVTGTQSPFEYLQEIRRYSTADISARVEQDVLLLAGAEDHYVPLTMFYRQIEALTRVRSLTARLFTRAEHAQNHCQLGNLSQALRVIINWLEMQLDVGGNADNEQDAPRILTTTTSTPPRASTHWPSVAHPSG